MDNKKKTLIQIFNNFFDPIQLNHFIVKEKIKDKIVDLDKKKKIYHTAIVCDIKTKLCKTWHNFLLLLCQCSNIETLVYTNFSAAIHKMLNKLYKSLETIDKEFEDLYNKIESKLKNEDTFKHFATGKKIISTNTQRENLNDICFSLYACKYAMLYVTFRINLLQKIYLYAKINFLTNAKDNIPNQKLWDHLLKFSNKLFLNPCLICLLSDKSFWLQNNYQTLLLYLTLKLSDNLSTCMITDNQIKISDKYGEYPEFEPANYTENGILHALDCKFNTYFNDTLYKDLIKLHNQSCQTLSDILRAKVFVDQHKFLPTINAMLTFKKSYEVFFGFLPSLDDDDNKRIEMTMPFTSDTPIVKLKKDTKKKWNLFGFIGESVKEQTTPPFDIAMKSSRTNGPSTRKSLKFYIEKIYLGISTKNYLLMNSLLPTNKGLAKMTQATEIVRNSLKLLQSQLGIQWDIAIVSCKTSLKSANNIISRNQESTDGKIELKEHTNNIGNDKRKDLVPISKVYAEFSTLLDNYNNQLPNENGQLCNLKLLIHVPSFISEADHEIENPSTFHTLLPKIEEMIINKFSNSAFTNQNLNVSFKPCDHKLSPILKNDYKNQSTDSLMATNTVTTNISERRDSQNSLKLSLNLTQLSHRNKFFQYGSISLSNKKDNTKTKPIISPNNESCMVLSSYKSTRKPSFFTLLNYFNPQTDSSKLSKSLSFRQESVGNEDISSSGYISAKKFPKIGITTDPNKCQTKSQDELSENASFKSEEKNLKTEEPFIHTSLDVNECMIAQKTFESIFVCRNQSGNTYLTYDEDTQSHYAISSLDSFCLYLLCITKNDQKIDCEFVKGEINHFISQHLSTLQMLTPLFELFY